MLRALEERREQRQRAIEAARGYCEALVPLLGPLSAFLYGSMAKGDFGPGSDTDVRVISDRLPEHPLRRLDLLFSKVVGNSRIEPKGLASSEFASLTERGTPWLQHILNEGITLRDDLGVITGARSEPGAERVDRGKEINETGC